MLDVNSIRFSCALFCISLGIFTSCQKEDDKDYLWWHNADIVELDASNYELSIIDTSAKGDFIKFSFSKGEVVTNEKWDVAFRGTTIIVNGGETSYIDQPDRTGNAAVYIAIGSMMEIVSVDTTILLQDNNLGSAILNNTMIDDLGVSGQGWALYSLSTHLFSPRAGRILVFRTHDNKYVKMEIIYFYDSLNPNVESGDIGGYYTFNYVYQPDGGIFF